MLNRFNKLLATIIVVGLACYAFYLNPENVTIRLGADSALTAPLGILLLIVFGFGILLSATGALWFGLRAHFRERELLNRDRKRQEFIKLMVKARSYSASGEFGRARRSWEDLISMDPSTIISRIELSRCLEAAGDLREALRVLDAARAADSHNIEVLFRAAELHQKLGNRTAAVDNLALALSHQPSLRAASMARDLSEELGRIEDAFEYQSQVEKLDNSDTDYADIAERLRYKKILRDNAEDQVKLRDALRSLTLRGASARDAALRLAELELQGGSREEAAKCFAKAGKLSGFASDWLKAAEVWLEQKNPDKALSIARAAIGETQGKEQFIARANLIRMYVTLHMYEEAQRTLSDLDGKGDISPELKTQITVLKALFANLSGDSRQCATLLKRISMLESAGEENAATASHTQSNDAPAARLSTP